MLQISHYVLQTFNLSNNKYIAKGDKTAFTLLKIGLEVKKNNCYTDVVSK